MPDEDAGLALALPQADRENSQVEILHHSLLVHHLLSSMELLLAPVHEAQPFMLLLVLIGLCTRQRSCYLRVPESRVEDANAVASSTCSLG